MRKRKLVIPVALILLVSLFSGCSDDETREMENAVPPGPVTNLKATTDDGKVLLEWANPFDKSFVITQISFSPANNLEQPINVAKDYNTKEINNLENGVEYTFSVRTTDIYRNKSEEVKIKATPKGVVVEDPEPTEFVDERDNKTYKMTTIGNQVWMAENLAYLPEGATFSAGGDGSNVNDFTKHYYVQGFTAGGTLANVNNDPELKANLEEYGVMYNWYAAIDLPESVIDTTSFKEYYATFTTNTQGVCPAGWRLPSDDDFKQLEMFLGMSEEITETTGYRGINSEGNRIKSVDGWQTPGGSDEVGFGLKAAGRWKTKFEFIGQYAYLWTSTFSHFNIKTSDNVEYPEVRTWLRYVKHDQDRLARSNWEHFNGYSVRCVKDKEEK